MTFPFRALGPVEHAGPLPAETDVAVIGGGIIGVMTVWELARRGIPAVLLEKGRVAGEQSSRNWGWIRVQGRDLDEIPIMLEAQAMWPRLAQAAGGGIGLRQTGTLYLAATEAKLARYAAWLDRAQGFQLSTRLLNAAEVAAHLPQATPRYAGGLYTPTDLRAEPWATVPALARAAVADGATIVENCAARTLDISAGRVTGVMTERGLLKAQAVVLAGGAWSSLFLRRHGVTIPQLSVRATVAATAPMPSVHDGGAINDKVAWRRRDDGGYSLAPANFHEMLIGPDAFRALPGYARHILSDFGGTRYVPMSPRHYPDAWGTPRRWQADEVSPFERMRLLDPAPNAACVARLAADFAATFPGAGPVKIAESWAGMIDSLPDIVPVVDTVAALPGLTLCTGMCGHGFGIGPAFGRIAAALATGDAPGHDLRRFRLARFSDGSTLVPGPTF